MKSKLKTLELHGFKTFANRTVFEYPAQITTIVGPNGSGKSNIADALRWVLGEQSFSLLRGRKTEDMIFSGSEQRARASMTQVTLTMDNEDKWLPIDFSEVTISRRAYRDGQNEYFLNGQRVRLKEISELLAQSGLGQRTYTIIGQGLVDAALSLKPEERRRFFEEAAGIGLYRSRREEALSRLEDTRRNLERLHDIILELEPRLRSLEKQAQRAQEYERIKADLQVLLREWYGYHWNRTQAELSNAHTVQSAQQQRLTEARKRLSEVSDDLEHQRKTLQDLRQRLNTMHIETGELHAQREKVSRNLAVLEERQRSLLDQHKSLQTDRLRLEGEYQSRCARLEALKQEEQELLEELNDVQVQRQQAQNELNGQQTKREQLEKTLRETRQQLISAEKHKVELAARQRELEERFETLRKMHENLEKTLQNDLALQKAAEEHIKLCQEQRDKSEQALKHAEDDLNLQRKQSAQIEENLKSLNDKLAEMSATKARLQAQLEVLEQAERSLSGLNQGAQSLLEASRKGQLRGKFLALSHLMDVPKDYEVAIAAVLGEYLDSILLGDPADADSALDWLSADAKGRAVLLPPTLRHDIPNLAYPANKDIIGLASDLVKVEPHLQPVMQLLLGNAIVVQDRQTARKLVKNLPTQAKVVTLKGEIFWGNGVITAGQDNRAGIIGRPRQKRELQDAINKASEEIQQTQKHIQELRKNLEEQRLIEKRLQSEYQTRQQENSAAQQKYQKANLEVEQVRQRVAFQRHQLEQTVEQITQGTETLKNIDVENRQADVLLQDLQSGIRVLNRQLAELSLEELQTQLAHWNTAYAVLEKSIENKKAQREEYQASMQADVLQLQTFNQRLDNLNVAMRQLETEKAALLEQENSLNQKLHALQAQIEPHEQELSLLEKSFSEKQNQQITAQQAVTVAERYVAQAQIEVSKHREALDSLRRRIEDDFGLVAFQYTTDVLGPTPLPLEGMVQQLPKVVTLSPEIEENVSRHRAQLRRMGAVNLEAQAEYNTVKERYEYLSAQIQDLRKAEADLRKIISELDDLMRREFRKTFNAVAAEFRRTFTRLFGGGTARLVLVDEDNLSETGIEIETRLPGRREQGLLLLSGGERSLTAVALIFSLLKVSPTPFCVLDEVDAMLDEANVGRFCELLRELSQNTQFIIITHNRNTVQTSEVIYGVTMGHDSTSQVISLKLDEVDKVVK
ncbi:MAG: chromosome segregation protein SMC [Anaerolineae bacterium]|nr:chromosome segregation protein SMC [Anaerolineae bacterium]